MTRASQSRIDRRAMKRAQAEHMKAATILGRQEGAALYEMIVELGGNPDRFPLDEYFEGREGFEGSYSDFVRSLIPERP